MNGIFSNFWMGKKIRIDDIEWPSIEHFFQAEKYQLDPYDHSTDAAAKTAIRNRIRESRHPEAAKSVAYERGNNFVRMHDSKWSAVGPGQKSQERIRVMYRGVYEKFRQDPVLAAALAFTAGHQLVETMPLGGRKDVFWGVVNGTGANMLGQILHQVRDDLARSRRVTSFDVRFNTDENQTW